MLPSNIRSIFDQRPLGLVFDIDGTLSPIVSTPDEARLYPGVGSLLEKFREKAHVAILTGRCIDSAAKLVNIDGLTYIGTHGLEWSEGLPWLHPIYVIPEAIEYIKPARELLDFADIQLAHQPGIIVEHKRVGGTVHYRLAPNPEQARQKILSVMEKCAAQANLCLSEGKRVVEVRTPVKMNKGLALRQFVRYRELQGVIFAGDDRTDLDAIYELARLRQEGKVTLGVVVQHADTLPELLELADTIVQGVEGMAKLLQEMVEPL